MNSFCFVLLFNNAVLVDAINIQHHVPTNLLSNNLIEEGYLKSLIESNKTGVTSQSPEFANILDTFCSEGTVQEGIPQALMDCFQPLCDFMDNCQTVFDDFISNNDSSSNVESPPPTAEQLHDMCESGCLTQMFDVFMPFGICLEVVTVVTEQPVDMEMEDLPHQVDILCTRNPVNDQYCSVAFLEVSDAVLEFEDRSMSNLTAYEKQVVCGTVSDLGCCLGNFFEIENASSDGDFNKDVALDICQWSKITPSCGKMGETKKMIVIQINSDIPWNEWSSLTEDEKKAAQFAAATDLTGTLGVNYLLATTFTKGPDDKLQLNFTVDSTDSTDSTIVEQIQTTLSNDGQMPNWSNLTGAIRDRIPITEVKTSDADVEEKDVTHQFNASSAQHYITIGGPQYIGECQESDGCETRLASNTEVHDVRCCSDVTISGWSEVCNGLWSESDAWGECITGTYDEAKTFCESQGGRLCTLKEYQRKCAHGTGCNYDRHLLWTSSFESDYCSKSIPCIDGWMCNYDNGNDGFCEDCEHFPTMDSCRETGFHTQEGTDECFNVCVPKDHNDDDDDDDNDDDNDDDDLLKVNIKITITNEEVSET